MVVGDMRVTYGMGLWRFAKHKIASISLTVGDRAISSKIFTPMASKEHTKPIFHIFKKFSKMAAILNFLQNTKFLLSP